MDGALLHSIWTVVAFVTFVGIVVWAWAPKRKARLDAHARIPLEDDDGASASTSEEES